jgi:nicotinamidase-related amidase
VKALVCHKSARHHEAHSSCHYNHSAPSLRRAYCDGIYSGCPFPFQGPAASFLIRTSLQRPIRNQSRNHERHAPTRTSTIRKVKLDIGVGPLPSKRIDPIPREATAASDKNNAAVLLVDHQADSSCRSCATLSRTNSRTTCSRLRTSRPTSKLPTILTTSFEDGPNGALVPEQKEKLPNAPFIPRPGQINAWDNENFVKAVKATGKKQLIIAGVVTEVCVAFPALSALEEGYEVFVVTDASGTFNEVTRHSAWDRMSAAGAQPRLGKRSRLRQV